jgi:hypothetical protein
MEALRTAGGVGREAPSDRDRAAVSLDDFYAYMPTHAYIYTPSREMWASASINARIPRVVTFRLIQKSGDAFAQWRVARPDAQIEAGAAAGRHR